MNAALPAVTLSPHIALHPPREVLFYSAASKGSVSKQPPGGAAASRSTGAATDRSASDAAPKEKEKRQKFSGTPALLQRASLDGTAPTGGTAMKMLRIVR